VTAARVLRRLRRHHPAPPEGFPPLRLALLATFTPSTLLPALEVAVAGLGASLDLYLGGMDQLRSEVLDPGSGLYAHAPDVVVLGTTWRDLTSAPVDDQVVDWVSLWERVLERTGAHVIQHTFDRPLEASLGHLELRTRGSRRRTGAEVNLVLAERAPARVSLVDYEQALFRCGAERALDPRQWFWAKEALTPSAAPYVVEEYAAVLRALRGRTRKVLVLDLDDTLWGGIVGEDGPGGLKVGPPSIEGEAHQALQRYAAELRARGVLLAVCSKNNPEDARQPFVELPDMVLRLSDFAAFEAGWDPKPETLRRVAAALRLGLDSFVFVDDNPAERALVRRRCPEVLTIPLPADPSEYVRALHAARAFETLSISDEDRQRADQYGAESQRREVQGQAGSLEEFWASLEMVATVRRFHPADVERIVQLAARSNQFNLTTWRLTAAEVEALQGSPRHECRTVRLRDRFGDYGLVAVLVGEVVEDALEVAALFMSCRVLGRGVERLLASELEQMAAGRGCRRVVGIRRPTAKNQMTEPLYPGLGFEPLPAGAGEQRWQRPVDPARPGQHQQVRVERDEESQP
jgi:FkbH-like protein